MNKFTLAVLAAVAVIVAGLSGFAIASFIDNDISSGTADSIVIAPGSIPEPDSASETIPDDSQVSVATKPTPERDGPRLIGGVQQLSLSGPDGAISAKIMTVASDDLPAEDAESVGVFKSFTDDTMVIGTGPIELGLDVEIVGDGPPMPSLTLQNFGPDLEVFVPADAVIFNDVTESPSLFSGDLKDGDNFVQQILKPLTSIENVPKNTIVTVWGDRRGDRVVAKVVVLKTEQARF